LVLQIRFDVPADVTVKTTDCLTWYIFPAVDKYKQVTTNKLHQFLNIKAMLHVSAFIY